MNNTRSRMKQVRFRVNFHNSLGMGWGSPFFCTINWKADIPSSAVYIYAYSSYTPAKSDIDISFIAQLDGDYQGKLFCSVHKPKYNILRKKSKSSEYKCMYQNINSSFSPFDHYSSSVTGQHAEQFLSQTALNVNGRYKSIISLNPNAYKPFQKLTSISKADETLQHLRSGIL